MQFQYPFFEQRDFYHCVLEMMVGRIIDSFSATNMNKVFGGGSSINFNQFVPFIAEIFRHPHDEYLVTTFETFKLNFRMISLHS